MRTPFRRQPAERFDEVLARCLAAIEAGEATVESCLAAHPRHAARLAPLLRAAAGVRRGLSAAPDPAFARRLRARVLAGAAAPPVVPRTALWWHGLRRPVIAMAMAALVLLLVIGLAPMAVVTSADALPGDWNYGLKLKTEELLLALGLRDHLDRADERAREIRQLAVIGRYQEIPEVTRAYRAELVEVTKPLERPQVAPPQEVRRIEQRVAVQETVIQQAAAKVEQEAQQLAGPPPPVVVEAHQAAQVALSAAAQTRRQVSRAAAEAQAQERATSPPTPAGTVASAPSPMPEPSETAPPATVTSASPAEGTPGATGTPDATPRPGGPPGAVTLPTLPPVTATAPAPPAPARTVTPAPTRTVTAPPPAAVETPSVSTPAPSTPAPRPAVTPTPSATLAGPSVTVLELRPGVYTFLYTGPAGPVDTVLAALGLDGKYQWVEWRPAGSPLTVRYEPGVTGFRPVITTYAVVTVSITSPANVPQGVLVPLLR